jgi:chromosome segregation protein
MLLESIKLSGFKSFADKTVIEIRSHLNAIVGPNGCGKSNVVDAIRWVIGESSAKQLRSQSMADVIFNGTTKRSAAGRAHVELCFNNHMGRIAGPFAEFDTIQIAREVTTDGQSNYSINQRHCRRKDILDLFCGTGMGSRSYSIIEQGMISRLVEAKPEELRIFLEEACGISKYKDRRKETQTRMGHCEENLARVNDICEELGSQYRKLSKQARNAERYQALSNEEHTLKNQLLALKYDALREEKLHLETTLQEKQATSDLYHEQLQMAEQSYEHLLENQKSANELQYEQQAKLYAIQNSIQSIEQTLAHQRAQKIWREEHLERTNQAYKEYQAMMEDQIIQAEQLRENLFLLTPKLNQSELDLMQTQEALHEAKNLLEEKNQEWSSFLETKNSLASKINLFEQKIKHIQYVLNQANHRYQTLQTESDQMDLVVLEQRVQTTHQAYDQLQASTLELDELIENNASSWQTLNQGQKQIQDQLASARTQSSQVNGRLASLMALQEAALNDDGAAVKDWLSTRSLEKLSRLAQEIEVDTAWEHALEVVLADAMRGICLKDNEALEFLGVPAPKGTVTLLSKSFDDSLQSLPRLNHQKSLADVVKTQFALPVDLSQIILAEDEEHAKSMLASLPPFSSVILKDGRRFSRHWCQFTHQTDAKSGILQRGREMAELENSLDKLNAKVNELIMQKDEMMERLASCEEERAPLKARHQSLREQLNKALSDKSQAQSQFEHKKQRQIAIEQQCLTLSEEIAAQQTQLHECEMAHAQAQEAILQIEATYHPLSNEKTQAQAMIVQLNQNQVNAQSLHQQMLMTKARHEDQLKSLELMIEKSQIEINRLASSRSDLLQSNDDEPDSMDLTQELALLHIEIKKQQQVVADAKQQLSTLEMQLREAHQLKQQTSEMFSQSQEKISHFKLTLQSCLVKQAAVLESFEQQAKDEASEKAAADARAKQAILAQAQEQTSDEALGDVDIQNKSMAMQQDEISMIRESMLSIDFASLAQQALEHWLQHLPDTRDVQACQHQLSAISSSISRLGPINLAAIEECAEVENRKDYLEKQKSDLEEALTTLRGVIADMDHSCKTTLKETYDKVNTRFQEIFPSVFGGGQASLEMMEDDILTTGILVRAQPPGKKVAAIHMLSGGEKALTAISLVFALFSLNPAPFCILDEVDAPLDDQNVERYCRLIKDMAKETQFLVISHNKSTIAHMEHLIGVTMGEPGVSRIVSVDMQEALAMLE